MKKAIRNIAAAILLILMYSTTSVVYSQPSPPPPPADHGHETNQSGGSAPIGGGLFILIGLGIGYGAKRMYDAKKEIAD